MGLKVDLAKGVPISGSRYRGMRSSVAVFFHLSFHAKPMGLLPVHTLVSSALSE